MKKAIILFSGGLDSTVCLAMAKAQGFSCYALSIDYGQHPAELQAAEKIAKQLQVAAHKTLAVPLKQLATSSLTDARLVKAHQAYEGVSSNYVPARNTVFLSLALAWMEGVGAHDIFIGACLADGAGFPDCREAYFSAYENLMLLATKQGVEGQAATIHTPILHWSKAEIVAKGLALGVDLAATFSCYAPTANATPCGVCESCVCRQQGFDQANGG